MKNKIEILGDKAVVYMPSNKECIISTKSIPLIQDYRWCVEGTGYAMSKTTGKAVKMHRIITGAGKN